MIFVYVLIYMDFISELVFIMQNSVQISAASHYHSGEVCDYVLCQNGVNVAVSNTEGFMLRAW